MNGNGLARKITTMAMFAAASIVLVYLIRFPFFAAAPFLEYDPANIPILIATYLFGPSTGLMLTFVVSVIQGITVSAQSGIIGIAMHIFATGSFVLSAGMIYNRKRSFSGLVVSAICGTLAMTVAMILWNLIFTPLFMGTPIDTVAKMLVPIIIPFNLLKGSINAFIAVVMYKMLSTKGVFKEDKTTRNRSNNLDI